MPIISVRLLAGYGVEARQRLARSLTNAVRAVVPAGPEAVTVMIDEVAPDNYMRGGESRPPAPALPDPAETVERFLRAMEDRDLETARAMLGEGFEMIFPGDVRMRELEELIEWSKPRYRGVRKSFEGFDVAPGDETVTVCCFGTLKGEWPDGTAFSGIRFTDRFELRGGLIVSQRVWNDLAVTREAGT